MNKIFIRLVNLPCKVKGYTSVDSEGNYNVYINENMSPEMQRKTYNHEITHIKRNDWSDIKTLKQAEMLI